MGPATTTVPAIADAARLPGAFIFFRIKLANGDRYGVVAYDPKITSKTTLASLQLSYLITGGGAGLPYYEKFAQLSSDTDIPWKNQDKNVTFAGLYGGPDPDNGPPKRGQNSPQWLWSKDSTSPIQNGIFISYWNYSTSGSGQGVHTASRTKTFNKGCEVPYMRLFEGNKTNLVPTDASLLRNTFTELFVDYYATFGDNSLGWEKEKIKTEGVTGQVNKKN